MVTVYGFDITRLPDPKEHPVLISGLSAIRQQKILKFRHEKGRKQSLGAGLLLHQVLPMHGGREADICYGENGKPELDNLFFNVSHSGNLVICAISDKAIGCDVEQIRPGHDGVAKHFFSEKEKSYLQQADPALRDLAFFRIWTIRESYMKMTGEGMQLELSAFEVEISSDNHAKIIRNGEYQSCHIQEYPWENYRISVCGTESEFSPELVFFTNL